jgi:1-acyl-sn-glycerol-3-phosphate acyltransferase
VSNIINFFLLRKSTSKYFIIYRSIYLMNSPSSFLYMILWYILNTILIPIVLLPVSLVMNVFGFRTRFWEICVDVFFKMFFVNNCIAGDPIIERGFILANHRTWCDFAYDPYISKSSMIGRHLAFLAMSFLSLLLMLDQRCIIINRKDKRDVVFTQIIEYMNSNSLYSGRILVWPEGTRRDYIELSLEQTRSIIKPGLLKSIYEYKQYPVQLMISKNKEIVFNEQTIKVGLGQTIYTCFSKPIHPSDYKTFEEFFETICQEWFEYHNLLYMSYS